VDNVEDLEALRKYLHLGHISIAAHGWGAVIALEYARKYHHFVNSIILVTPISPFSPESGPASLIDNLPPEAREDATEIMNNQILSMLERREELMRVVMPALFHRQEAIDQISLGNLRYSPEVNVRLGEELGNLDLYPVLHQIRVPTLVMVGRHDIVTPVRDQMAYADGIGTSSAVVFNESGHYPFLEERAFFVALAEEFLLNRRVPTLVQAMALASAAPADTCSPPLP
jgi:proline iminopeptidase